METRVRQLVGLLAEVGDVLLPLAASRIAEHLAIVGTAESRRRIVRMIVEAAREAGHAVCADADGYWLARSHAEWAEYQAARQSGARFEFVRLRRMAAAAGERANGQRRLFAEPADTRCFRA